MSANAITPDPSRPGDAHGLRRSESAITPPGRCRFRQLPKASPLPQMIVIPNLRGHVLFRLIVTRERNVSNRSPARRRRCDGRCYRIKSSSTPTLHAQPPSSSTCRSVYGMTCDAITSPSTLLTGGGRAAAPESPIAAWPNSARMRRRNADTSDGITCSAQRSPAYQAIIRQRNENLRPYRKSGAPSAEVRHAYNHTISRCST